MGQSHHTLLHLEPCPVQTHSSTEKSVFITLPDIVSPSADLLTDNNTSGWYDNKSQSFRLVAKNIFISSSTVLTARLKTWTYNKVNMIINSSFWYSRIWKKEGQTLFYLLTVFIDAYSLETRQISLYQSLIFSLVLCSNDDGDGAATACSLPRRYYLYQTNNAHQPWPSPYLPTCHHS